MLARQITQAVVDRAVMEGCPYLKTSCALADLRCCAVVEEWIGSRKARKSDFMFFDLRTTAYMPKDLFPEEAGHGYKQVD